MKDDETLMTGAAFVGAGVAGYALGRFVLARWLDDRALKPTIAPALPAAHVTTTGSTAPAPPPPAQSRPSPVPTRATKSPRPNPPSTIDPYPDPVTSPAEVGQPIDPYDGPIRSPAEAEERAPVPQDSDVGPVTSASEVEHPAESEPERSRPSRRYDRIFDMYRGSIPIEFLRALSKRESSMNPEEAKGAGWGLMQVVEVVRKDYNERHGTKYTRKDLLDPAINVAICCWLLHLIIAQYAKHHPDIPNMREDWDNPRFAQLVCFGWNAGFSSAGGVIKVVRYLKQRGHVDVTIDLVHQHARAAGASKHLSNAKKVRFCKSVVRLYEQERAVPVARPV